MQMKFDEEIHNIGRYHMQEMFLIRVSNLHWRCLFLAFSAPLGFFCLFFLVLWHPCFVGLHIHGLAHAASGYHRVLEENRKLYNQVQDLKGTIVVSL